MIKVVKYNAYKLNPTNDTKLIIPSYDQVPQFQLQKNKVRKLRNYKILKNRQKQTSDARFLQIVIFDKYRNQFPYEFQKIEIIKYKYQHQQLKSFFINSNFIMTQYQKQKLKKIKGSKNYELLSTNLIKDLHYLNDYNQISAVNYSSHQVSLNQQDCQGSQSELDIFSESIQEEKIQIPYKSAIKYLINSIASEKTNSLKMIEQKKRNYEQLFKKKQQNRQKFLQKMNQNIFNSKQNDKNQVQSQYLIQLQKQTRNNSIINTDKTKNMNKNIKRSQTEENKNKQLQKQKSNQMFKNQLICQMPVSQKNKRQGSQRKKIRITKKNSVNSNNQSEDFNSQLSNSRKVSVNNVNYNSNASKQGTLSMSKNQFLFFQQYQKDQKQIMDRLLNIIESQIQQKKQNLPLFNSKHTRQGERESLQNSYDQVQNNFIKSKIKARSLQNSKKWSIPGIETQFSSVKPIVINNYIKSPTQFADKALIQKQIAIRLLQQSRSKRKIEFLKSMQNSRIAPESRMITLSQKFPVDYKKISQNQNKFDYYLQNMKHYEPQKFKNQFKSTDEINFQELFQKLKNQNLKASDEASLIKENQDQLKAEKGKKKIEQNLLNIDYTQNQNISPLNYKNKQKQNPSTVRQFSESKFSESTKQIQTIKELKHFSDLQKNKNKKQSILMEISFRNQICQKQNISLADAFKKKFGQNKFSKKNKTFQNVTIDNSIQAQALSELKISQNQINLQAKSKEEKPLRKGFRKITKKKQNSIQKSINAKEKQNFNQIETQRDITSNSMVTERSICTNTSNMSTIKQPSKQLLDRLIYGGRANMSKKQMYDLTKKNYSKLPQIEEKKRQEERKLKQLERLLKIKQYQKRIRSSKRSLTKQSVLKQSVQQSQNEKQIHQK